MTHLGESIKQYKSMVILRDFPYNNALFGLVDIMTPVKISLEIWSLRLCDASLVSWLDNKLVEGGPQKPVISRVN